MDQSFLERINQKHNEQRELFEYQNSRVLARPKTTVLSVVAYSLAYLLFIAACVILNILIKAPLYLEIPISVVIYVIFSELSLKYIGIKIVECYQHYASEKTRRQCMCVPSCSEYSIICLKKYGLLRALIKIRRRLKKTCRGPLFKVDPP